jgi:hypothetical protein
LSDSLISITLSFKVALRLEGDRTLLDLFPKTAFIFHGSLDKYILIPCANVTDVFLTGVRKFFNDDILSFSMFSLVAHIALIYVFFFGDGDSMATPDLIERLFHPSVDNFFGYPLLFFQGYE